MRLRMIVLSNITCIIAARINWLYEKNSGSKLA